MTAHIGDGDLGLVEPRKDFGAIKRHPDNWTMWRRVTVNGRAGHVDRVEGDRIGVTFDDCRWHAHAWEDFEPGGQYYDTLWSDVPTFPTRATAYAAMVERFGPEPDGPFADERYSVSSVTEWVHQDEVEPNGWELCWGGIVYDEHRQGITGLPHPADRAKGGE